MQTVSRILILLVTFVVGCDINSSSQTYQKTQLEKAFESPPPSASPWVFWYWMQASVSKEGITADLQAMKEVGIAGAYLMPIKGPATPSLIDPPLTQLSPQWWEMVKHAFAEAKRLGLKFAIHASDGFALAGGPWITPELSMQKIVWSEKYITGGREFNDTVEQPETLENYYKDIAVFAFPSPGGSGVSTRTIHPKITSSKTDSAVLLLTDPSNKKNFNSDEPCWIQYQFDQPFTCRSIVIHSRNNYQSNRFIVQTSADGTNFRTLTRLEAPRHGWQDWDADYTHSIPATTSKYFRFVYDKEGSEPGAEDLDAAKWKQSLKLTGLELFSEARIHQYESKNGEVWRIAPGTTAQQIPDSICVSMSTIVDITNKMDKNGRLNWNVPTGDWTIIRIGHTSTAHKNETAGGGKGLECDKFNPEAITLQFNKWFGEFYNHIDAFTIKEVLQFFHVDSWECGSQNWSPVFRDEFKKRRHYDPYSYLPVMAGVPLQSAEASEKFLHDVRETIAELVNDNFYGTLVKLAHQKGVQVTAESVAPTMVSDGMLHYKSVDVPMGEFWLRSPTHDKPNDMLDAISAAHIYGKNIIQAEGFTELRMAWDEYPGMLKTLLDRNYALGINRMVYHVFTHNPWLDRKPGMTLDPIGLYFQRDQTWWKQAKAWVDYAKRCQALLQMGKPVVDIAVFTGDDFPRRAVLPDRLVPVLPGIFGKEVVEKEEKRLRNEGSPLMQMPAGVTHSANMTDAADWIDPLHGYAYDSYNLDALQNLSSKNSKIELRSGPRYRLLILPGVLKMSQNPSLLSSGSDSTSLRVIGKRPTILMMDKTNIMFGISDSHIMRSVPPEIYIGSGNGKIHEGPYYPETFSSLGILPDFLATASDGRVEKLAWTHRSGNGFDIYFISNQMNSAKIINLSLRAIGKVPELWDPLSGKIRIATNWKINNGRTDLPVFLDKNASLFIVLQKPTTKSQSISTKNWIETKTIQNIEGNWSVQFDSANGGPNGAVPFPTLTDWSVSADSSIRYYSGTARYTKKLNYHSPQKNKTVWLNVGVVNNVAEVFVNGISCGVAWTPPFRVDVTKALKEGANTIWIDVVNTWNNRLVGDSRLLQQKRITSTVYPFKWENKPLLPAGLIGPVVLETEK